MKKHKAVVAFLFLPACSLLTSSLTPPPGFSDFFIGVHPSAIAAGDLNGDGFIDLAVANKGLALDEGDIGILLGKGDGSFRFLLPSNTSVGFEPNSIVIADLNGDAILDLAAANQGSNNVSVLFGIGDASFEPRLDFSVVGDEPRSIVAADLDGDEKLDLATANQGSNNISLLFAKDSFKVAIAFPVGTSPVSLVALDFDQNGKLDLATANQGSGDVSLLLENNGSFEDALQFPVGDAPVDLVVHDIGGDDKLDLITVSATEVVALFHNPKNQGAVTIITNSINSNMTSPSALAVGLLSPDGNNDIVYADPVRGLTIMLGGGDGTFVFDNQDVSSEILFDRLSGPVDVVVEDFNGDAKFDLATADDGKNAVSVILQF
jgi:hypothetical protein